MLPNLSALRHESAPTGVKPKGAKDKAKKQKKKEKDLARDIQDAWDDVHRTGDANDMMNPLMRLLGYGQQKEVHQFLLGQYANAQRLPACNKRPKPKGRCDKDYQILITNLRKRWNPDLFRGGPWD